MLWKKPCSVFHCMEVSAWQYESIFNHLYFNSWTHQVSHYNFQVAQIPRIFPNTHNESTFVFSLYFLRWGLSRSHKLIDFFSQSLRLSSEMCHFFMHKVTHSIWTHIHSLCWMLIRSRSHCKVERRNTWLLFSTRQMDCLWSLESSLMTIRTSNINTDTWFEVSFVCYQEFSTSEQNFSAQRFILNSLCWPKWRFCLKFQNKCFTSDHWTANFTVWNLCQNDLLHWILWTKWICDVYF